MAPTVSFTTQQAAVKLTRDDLYWGESRGEATTVTYGFRAFVPDWYQSDPDSREGDSFSKFTATQMKQAALALKQISDVCRIEFTRVNPDGYTNQATMLFGNYESTTDGASAFASLPDDPRWAAHDGDFWYNLEGDDDPGFNPAVRVGGFDFQTMVHELGHAVGLAHPGEYNAAAGSGRQPTYGRDAEYIQDSLQYSTMSYFDASFTGANHTFNGVDYYARTMLLHDIAALQRLYGANMETRTGNTTYGFNANTGLVDNRIYKLDSNAEKAVLCIWDAGGIDTLNFSGYTATQIINLNAEKFSSVGGLKWNWSIAKGATIENAVGGSGVDTIYGNGVANRLSGNSGADKIFGGLGNDTLQGGAAIDALHGGAGIDTADFSDRAFDIYVELNRAKTVTAYLSELANDTLAYIENFISGAGYDVLIGDTGANRIFGGAGDDVIQGNAGKDILDGGAGLHDGVDYAKNISGVRVELGGSAWKTTFLSNDLIADDQIRNFEDITSGSGNDTLVGNGLANNLASGAGDDVVRGGAGKDILDGGAGPKDRVLYDDRDTAVFVTLAGGTSKTVFSGDLSTAEDIIKNFEEVVSGGGNDTLTGDGLANVLISGGGIDTLAGGAGTDILAGQAAADVLEGGLGSDFFVFGGADLGLDQIGTDEVKDFSIIDDKIRLDHLTFTHWTGPGSVSDTELGSGPELALMAESNRLFYETDTGNLYYDADGKPEAGVVLVAKLAPGMLLTNSHFEIV